MSGPRGARRGALRSLAGAALRPLGAATFGRLLRGPRAPGQLLGPAALAWAGLAGPRPARAIMAGAEPDTPARRVDPARPDSPWSGVGSVVVNGSPYSGVAVAARWVLTAAHVVGRHGPEAVRFVVNLDGAPGLSLAVDRVRPFPGAAFPYDDYALLRLAEPLPPPVRRYALAAEAVPPGTLLRLVGIGASGHGPAGPSVPASHFVRRVGENVLDAYTEHIGPGQRSSRFFLYDFDGPTGRGPLGGPTLGNARETSVAAGDSGSGAFVQLRDRWVLLGINTFAAQQADGTPQPSRFGSIGGGLLVSDPRVRRWVDEETGGVVEWVEVARR